MTNMQQLKAGDKAILIPYEQGPFCPAVILDITEGQDGRQTYHGAYFNGSAYASVRSI